MTTNEPCDGLSWSMIAEAPSTPCCAFACGAAVAFGLMGMAFAIRSRPPCDVCRDIGYHPGCIYCPELRTSSAKVDDGEKR